MAAFHSELRSLADPPRGACRWIGRRLIDHPDGEEIVVVSLWNEAQEMDREVLVGRERLSESLRVAARAAHTEVYSCRAYGAWKRDQEPCVVRLFRGGVVEGDPDAFDSRAAQTYLANFECNPRCASIAAGVRDGGEVLLATLWTSWDAIVTATGGDLRRVLPIRLPGWAVVGTAVHYEIVAAESR
jgi:hypothetical protein